MSEFSDILTNVTSALAGSKESKDGLYGLLFGNKQIPVNVSLDSDTKTILLIAMGVLAAGAITTAFILKR
jgi:hypothetical protein